MPNHAQTCETKVNLKCIESEVEDKSNWHGHELEVTSVFKVKPSEDRSDIEVKWKRTPYWCDGFEPIGGFGGSVTNRHGDCSMNCPLMVI